MNTVDVNDPRPEDDSVDGPSRRTVLAAERTWLAWWRTGIAVSGVAIAVGGLLPHLVDGSRTPYVVLGACYAALAAVIFTIAFLRHREVVRALNEGDHVHSGERWMITLTVSGGLLALATLLIVALS